MNIRDRDDTIAAIATPIGEGGISVIRISGRDAVTIADKLFVGKVKLCNSAPRSIHFGRLFDLSAEMIDEVLIAVFLEPESYTGENTIEISCHGGYFVTKRILESVIANGARLADPGEFTLRAFLNGKIDLTQAESIADIIHSKTEVSLKASLAHLDGGLKNHIEKIRKDLIDLCSLLELELDFSQEGISLTSSENMDVFFESTITDINRLLDTYRYGRVVRDGVRVVFVGKPNVGKSSILNILLNQDRAIVSEIPGTTRDIIEEEITIDGVLFRLVDTAGLRDAFDAIEKEGIARTEAQIQKADIIVFVLDSSQIPDEKDELILQTVEETAKRLGVFIYYVFNKSDICSVLFRSWKDRVDLKGRFISCIRNNGIEELKKDLYGLVVPFNDSISSSVIIQNSRHKVLLERVLEFLILSRGSFKNKMSAEFIVADLRSGLDYLGEIIGVTTPDDILENIFSKFCVGK